MGKFKLRIGTRAQVMHGTAKMTGGGLTKKQLKYNKRGKIVSRKASRTAKKNNRLVKSGYVTRKGVFGVVRKGGMNEAAATAYSNSNSNFNILKNNLNFENEMHVIKDIKDIEEVAKHITDHVLTSNLSNNIEKLKNSISKDELVECYKILGISKKSSKKEINEHFQKLYDAVFAIPFEQSELILKSIKNATIIILHNIDKDLKSEQNLVKTLAPRTETIERGMKMQNDIFYAWYDEISKKFNNNVDNNRNMRTSRNYPLEHETCDFICVILASIFSFEFKSIPSLTTSLTASDKEFMYKEDILKISKEINEQIFNGSILNYKVSKKLFDYFYDSIYPIILILAQHKSLVRYEKIESIRNEILKLLNQKTSTIYENLLWIDFGDKSGSHIYLEEGAKLYKLVVSGKPLFVGKACEQIGITQANHEFIKLAKDSSKFLLAKYKEKNRNFEEKIECVKEYIFSKSKLDLTDEVSAHCVNTLQEKTVQFLGLNIFTSISGLDMNKYLLSLLFKQDDFNFLYKSFKGFDGVKWLIDNKFIYKEIFELFNYNFNS